MNIDAHSLPLDANPAPHAESVAGTAAAAAPITPGGGRPFTRTHLVTSLAFVAIAALDTLHPAMRIGGSWWLVLLVVWLMPWPNRTFDTARPMRLHWDELQQLVTLAVLSWLYASAWEVLMDALFTWRFIDPDGPLRRLDFPLQTALTGMAIAALLARPLQRAFGAQAAAAALLIAAPIVVLTCLESLSDVTRWMDRPLSNAIQTFDAVFPLLLLMQACVWLEHRSPAAAAHTEMHRTLGDQLGRLFDRVPSWFARSAVAPLLVLTAFTVALRGLLEGSGDVPPVLSAITTLLVPMCTLLLTAAAIHEHRKRRDARCSRPWCGRALGHRILSPLDATVGALLLSPLWLWTLLMDAPLAESYATDAIAALPGPAWTIEHDARRKTLRLSGEYQFGVAEAFAAALEKHPHAHTVELDGPGGRVNDFFNIAGAIETRNLSTRAVGDCESACTLAFLAGRERTLARDARLGFHSSWSPVALYDGDDSDIVAHLRHRGVAHNFVRKADDVPASDMWYPTNAELLAAHVITATH